MAQRLATPGVYIEEKSAFPKSVAGLPTAIPVFIGYTEKAVRDGKTLINKTVRIGSIGDYIKLFGGPHQSKFTIAEATPEEKNIDFEIGDKSYVLQLEGARFMFYNCLELFYANGGGDAYIVSVGNYETDGQPTAMSAKDFEAGIDPLIAEESFTVKEPPARGLAGCHVLSSDRRRNSCACFPSSSLRGLADRRAADRRSRSFPGISPRSRDWCRRKAAANSARDPNG